jgi:site-specific recombinase XerD
MFYTFEYIDGFAGQLQKAVNDLKTAVESSRQNLMQQGAAVFDNDSAAVFESLDDLKYRALSSSRVIQSIRLFLEFARGLKDGQ